MVKLGAAPGNTLKAKKVSLGLPSLDDFLLFIALDFDELITRVIPARSPLPQQFDVLFYSIQTDF
jgi:hypothetical protein